MSDVIKMGDRTNMSRHIDPKDALSAVAEMDVDSVMVIYTKEEENGFVSIGYRCARMDKLERLGALRHAEHMLHDDLAASEAE